MKKLIFIACLFCTTASVGQLMNGNDLEKQKYYDFPIKRKRLACVCNPTFGAQQLSFSNYLIVYIVKQHDGGYKRDACV